MIHALADLEQVGRAALAPQSPSSQVRKVAAVAQAKIARLRVEVVLEEDVEESEDGGAALRAVGAYAKIAGGNEVSMSTLELVACESCGRGHAPSLASPPAG